MLAGILGLRGTRKSLGLFQTGDSASLLTAESEEKQPRLGIRLKGANFLRIALNASVVLSTVSIVSAQTLIDQFFKPVLVETGFSPCHSFLPIWPLLFGLEATSNLF